VSAPAARSTAAYSASVSRVLINFVREWDIGFRPFGAGASASRGCAAMTHGLNTLPSGLLRRSLGEHPQPGRSR
jgi:hypothetical protein